MTPKERVVECLSEYTASDPDGDQSSTSNVWTGRRTLRANAPKEHPDLDRDTVDAILNELEDNGDILCWHGLVAPGDTDHLRAVIESERRCTHPRSALIGQANRLIQQSKQSDS